MSDFPLNTPPYVQKLVVWKTSKIHKLASDRFVGLYRSTYTHHECPAHKHTQRSLKGTRYQQYHPMYREIRKIHPLLETYSRNFNSSLECRKSEIFKCSSFLYSIGSLNQMIEPKLWNCCLWTIGFSCALLFCAL